MSVLPGDAPLFLPPWDGMDDAELLAYFRGPRGAYYYIVADAEETHPQKIEALMQGRFIFNGEEHRLVDPIEWLRNPSSDIEWHILLHKFYYAVGLGLAFERSGDTRYVERWVQLLDSWMGCTPPGFIAADVTGRRVQNWIYSLHLMVGHAAHDAGPALTPAFHRRLLVSLAQQVEYLCENLTPKRNHRTLELYAIFLASVVFPEMRRAAHWRAFAVEQTVANLASDLLDDGVHCELSTDYHHLVLKNALNFRRLAALNGVAVPPSFDGHLQRGLDFSLHVHQPSGNVPSLSDGDARGYLELLRQGAELFGREDMLYVASQGRRGQPPQERVAHFAASGYTVVRSHWGQGGQPYDQAQHLVFDCGPVGEGNHGHFDCLNFELAANGQALIVDPGRFTYSETVSALDGINWRVRFRSTAVHNTVCVDDRNQTRYVPRATKAGTRHVTGSVRHKIAGPAPDAEYLERHHTEGIDLLHGCARSHEYDAVHERCLVGVDGRYWIVSDWLRASTRHRYRLNFQLGPQAMGCTRLRLDDFGWQVMSPGLLILQPGRSDIDSRLMPSWVSARYGHKEAAPALQSLQEGSDADFDTVLLPTDSEEAAASLRTLVPEPADGSAQLLPPLLQLHFELEGQMVIDHWFHVRAAQPRSWRAAGLRFSGRWVHWRTTAAGEILRIRTHPGATALQDEVTA
jgi:Heparinase II/III N-terminus/Heparinase II/III-like protein